MVIYSLLISLWNVNITIPSYDFKHLYNVICNSDGSGKEIQFLGTYLESPKQWV